MAILRYILICFLLGFLCSCQFTYLVKGGYYQAKILSRQESVNSVIEKQDTKPEVKKKLELAQEVLTFLARDLGMETKGNYRTFVQLDDRYVSYAVTAAEKYRLVPFLWSFPIVGRVPYKGYFVRSDADLEAAELRDKGYDTMVRGVSAYSSLGWLSDPILSSMLNYRDEDFVNLIIHETVHANLYIKNAADFNEQLATFIGNKGSQAYFKLNAGLKTTAIQYTQNATHDEKLFSEFLSRELLDLETFYASNSQTMTDDGKRSKLKEIQDRFKKEVLPKLKTSNYKRFAEEELNNAILISYRTYLKDLSDFERVYQKYDNDFRKFFAFCKQLEGSDDPQASFRN